MRELHFLMIKAVLASLLVSSLLCVSGVRAQQPPGAPAASVASAEQEVKAAEAARLEAYLDHDAKAMSALLGDDLLHVTSDGRVRNKTQVMDQFVNDPTPFSQFVTDDMQILVFGDVAITRGRYHNLNAQRSYGPPLKHALFLRVWVKRNGAWQLVSHQATAAESTK
jgi:ketosteroid isomerase-like protein